MASLVKKIDAAGSKGLKSFVVYLNDDEDLPAKLKSQAKELGLKTTVYAVDNVTGPKAWKIAKDAEVTVILYNKRNVEANHAFAAGKLDSKGVDAVVKDLPKILKKGKASDDD